MYHVGVDLHKETSRFYIIDSNGKKVDSKNILNKPVWPIVIFPGVFLLSLYTLLNCPEHMPDDPLRSH
jgi:hypothetical protein